MILQFNLLISPSPILLNLIFLIVSKLNGFTNVSIDTVSADIDTRIIKSPDTNPIDVTITIESPSISTLLSKLVLSILLPILIGLMVSAETFNNPPPLE